MKSSPPNNVTLSLSKLATFHVGSLLAIALIVSTASAQEFANIEYLCADWGPAMRLSAKTNEPPQFSNTEEEVYFLKQVGRFTRKKRLVPDPLSGSTTEDVGHGISIYLCKMKPDGSEKTELKELWHDVRYPIDTQAQSTWMDVNEKTRKIALSVTFAGSDLTGLWTVNLDGRELKRIITPEQRENGLQAIDSPNWTPDGRWIVFAESWRGTNSSRIVKCDEHGEKPTYLTDGPVDTQPRVSPDGKSVLYVHNPWIHLGRNSFGDAWVGATLWLVDLDGLNKREIGNPQAKPTWQTKGIVGTYPAWSPDGKRIFAVSAGIVDVSTGKKVGYGAPKVQNWPKLNGQPANIVMPHWGKLGFLCSGWGGGIQLSDEAMEKMWILASSDIQRESKW